MSKAENIMDELEKETRKMVGKKDKNPWPMGVILPMKRMKEGTWEPELGVICPMAQQANKSFPVYITVFRCNIYMLPRLLKTKGAEKIPKEEFESLDEMIAAGWRVD